MFDGEMTHPAEGGVRLHIVLNNLASSVMSKSVDVPYTPGEG